MRLSRHVPWLVALLAFTAFGCCIQRTAVETGAGDQIMPITGAETWIEADVEDVAVPVPVGSATPCGGSALTSTLLHWTGLFEDDPNVSTCLTCGWRGPSVESANHEVPDE